jgi:hypothetical protein
MIHAARSQDNRYQYELTYQWAPGAVCGWILLNPSREEIAANHDPEHVRIGTTGQRCVNYALAWGYAGIVIRNRFAYRATDPGDLMRVDDPYGPENLSYLSRAKDDPITVVAWGRSRAVEVAPPLPGVFPLMCIGTNHDGSPRHVLHAPATAHPRPWP